jgi:hypothetical protein
MEIKELRIFETQNADLATYLMVEGVKLLEIRRSDKLRNVIVLRFLDEKHNCLDLERNYLSSEMKRFSDVKKYLLAKIHQALRDV